MNTIDLDDWLELSRDKFLEKWYETFYESCSYGGINQVFQNFSHRSLEKNISGHFNKVLELGAGTGQHCKFVQHSYDIYWETDIQTDNSIDVSVPSSEISSKIFRKSLNAEEIEVDDNYFDRVLHMCLLHHLYDPEKALLEMRRIVKNGGLISVYLPKDPLFWFRTAKRISNLKHPKEYKQLKKLADARDHMGNYFGIETLILHAFRKDKVKIYKPPLGRIAPSLWTIFQIEVIKK